MTRTLRPPSPPAFLDGLSNGRPITKGTGWGGGGQSAVPYEVKKRGRNGGGGRQKEPQGVGAQTWGVFCGQPRLMPHRPVSLQGRVESSRTKARGTAFCLNNRPTDPQLLSVTCSCGIQKPEAALRKSSRTARD